MAKLTPGQSVITRTVRTKTPHAGIITDIVVTPKGKWVSVLPDDKAAVPFKTRPAFCAPSQRHLPGAITQAALESSPLQ